MHTTLLHPLAEHGCPSSLSEAAGVAAFAVAAEAAGLGAVGFADHPAPSRRWMDAGGHGAFDPLTALAFVAGATTRLGLSTYLVVVPYRNPLLLLKQAASVDRLSGGRLSLTVGAGYLRSEFSVLGADFASRNDALDLGLEVLRSGWGTAEQAVSGADGYSGTVVLEPAPVQERLPVLVGGNSAASRRRAATIGDGWSPMVYDEAWSSGNRTAALTDLDDLATGVADLHHRARAAGRDPAGLVIQVDVPHDPRLALTAPSDEHLTAISALRSAGATAVVLRPPSGSLEECLEAVERYGAEVLPLVEEL